MDNTQFSMKELYSVQLKATLPIEVGNYTFMAGETVAAFDKIQISNFQEIRKYVTAHGGYEDRDRVIWETTKELDLVFTQGIFSKIQLSLLNNAKLIELGEQKTFTIAEREFLETNEDGDIELKFTPLIDSKNNYNIFIYNEETGEKITGCTMIDVNQIRTPNPYLDVIVDYIHEYTNDATELIIGQRALEGFLSLEGRTRVKDDVTGLTKTGIIKIPKLKLTSSLSMILGKGADPVVGTFKGKAIPVGSYGDSRVVELIFLEEDIDADIQ